MLALNEASISYLILYFCFSIQLESLKKGEVEADVDVAIKNTAQDFLDASNEELAQFKPASVLTGIVSVSYIIFIILVF